LGEAGKKKKKKNRLSIVFLFSCLPFKKGEGGEIPGKMGEKEGGETREIFALFYVYLSFRKRKEGGGGGGGEVEQVPSTSSTLAK